MDLSPIMSTLICLCFLSFKTMVQKTCFRSLPRPGDSSTERRGRIHKRRTPHHYCCVSRCAKPMPKSLMLVIVLPPRSIL
ncbi:hypothetical protein BDV12DRAFT_162186 [Aspergillus spectabilis]